GCVTFMNAVAERYTGWTQAQAGGRPLAEVFKIVNEATRAVVESPVAKVLREGAIVGLANHTVLIARDGSTRPIDDSGAPIRDAQGEVLGVVLVFRDISERRVQERERLEAERRKDEFLAMLAHELRNPLAVLSSGIQVLRRGSGAPATQQDTMERVGEAMERQIGQLARLVDDLLDVSRITLGKIELRKSPTRLEAVLQQAAEAALPAIQARGMELRFTAPAEALVVEADVARLSQVFGNLFSNAAKFGQRGGPIRVVSEAHAGQAVVRVQDTGIGIAPEVIGSVFELFVQADRSLARSEGGLGVGLAVAKVITELHGGSIEARSAGLGRGSEFIVRLPLAHGREPAGEAASLSRVTPRRILIVDDNADAAHALQALLQMAQHEVQVAFGGEEALRLGEAFRPQVVLLDIGLPGMDGYEVVRRLRRSAATRRALIVAVSGYGSEADRRRAREAGFDYHLTKPIAAGALEHLLLQKE
ncbi:MAG TPA: ATP-binding protein, partial [Burkholderiales bacterium]|nr:ATP-binding protein [Burkholderiales bacterium]